MKNLIHLAWIAAIVCVFAYGITTFNKTLRQHFFDEAKAARLACFHTVDDLEIKRGAPYGGNPIEGCTEIGTEYYK